MKLANPTALTRIVPTCTRGMLVLAAGILIAGQTLAADDPAPTYPLPDDQIDLITEVAAASGLDVHEQFFSEQPYEGTASCRQRPFQLGRQNPECNRL